jgi:hypothetical protein
MSEPEWEKETSMTLRNIALGAALAATMGLAACGTTTADRAGSGALLGAGAGAAIGSLSGNAGTGAIIGGLAGGAAGALTDPCTVNLGHPIWRDEQASREDYYYRCGHYPPN